MMCLVTRDNKTEINHGQFGVAGDAFTRQHFRGKSFEEVNGRLSQALHLVRSILNRPAVSIGFWGIIIFLETWQLSLVVPREAQGAIGKNSLDVNHVTEQLFNAPFANCITKFSLCLGY